jgi:hypothetical protein
MRAHAIVWIFLAVFLGAATPSSYAATGSGAARFRGFAADIDLFRSERWSYVDPMSPDGGFVSGGRPGLGLRLAYATSANVAPYVAVRLITHDWGQQNGTYTSVGIQLRQPWKRRIIPFANAGMGHLSDHGIKMSFDFAEVGAGLQFLVSGRLAFHPVLEIVRPLREGKRELDGGQTRYFPLDVNPWRASFGLTWYLGRRIQ